MSNERLDRLIDEVAKQLTAGQPSSDFRARVIASLDRRPGRVWRPIWIVAPLGTLAVAVLVVLVARPFQGRDRGAESPALQRTGQTVTAEKPPITPKAETPTVRRPPSPPGGFGETAGRRQDPSGRAAAEVAALAPPPLEVPPLGVEAIGVAALATDSIAVTQLDAITPIAVEPLPTDDERPASGQRRSPNDRNE